MKNRTVYRKNREGSAAVEWLMILPFLILFFIFTVIPFISSMVLSLTDFNMVNFPPKFVGINNYLRLFVDDPSFLKAVKNTLMLALITGPLGYFACLIFAWLVNELHPKIRTVFTLLFYAPTIAGNMYIIWSFIFSGDRYGIINSLFIQLGMIDTPIKWLTDPKYILGVIMIVQLWLSLGIGFLTFIAALQGIDRQIYEAGAIDGIKNRFQQLIKLTIPSMGPQLLFSAVMQISASFGVGVVSQALAGMPSTEDAALTVVLHMQDYGTLRYEMGYACAIATVLFMVMLITQKVIKKILARFL